MLQMDDDCAFCRSMGLYSRGHTKNNCFRLRDLQPCGFCGADGSDNHTASHCPLRPRVLLKLKKAPHYSPWILKHPQWILQSELLSMMAHVPGAMHSDSYFSGQPAAMMPLLSPTFCPPPPSARLGNDDCLMCGRRASIDCCYTSTSDTGSGGSAGTWMMRAPALAMPDLSYLTLALPPPSLPAPSLPTPIAEVRVKDKNNNINCHAAVDVEAHDGGGRQRSSDSQSSKGSSTVESYLVRFRASNRRRPPSRVPANRSKL